MSDKRLNSEKNISNDFFKLKLGTINKNSPSVIYLDANTFISPLFEKENYENDIYEIKKAFNNILKNEIINNGIFDKRFIFNFELKANGMKINKKSFLSIQCHFLQNGKILSLNEIQKNDLPIFIDIMKKCHDCIKEHNFIITKTK